MVRDFPLEAIHPQAFKAAEAAHCAGDQGKFWEMHSVLFADQRAIGPTDLVTHARTLNLDVTKFQECVDGGKHASRVRRDLAEGQKVGVQGTPTFFLGVIEGDGKVRALRVLRGAQGASAFKTAIDAALAAHK